MAFNKKNIINALRKFGKAAVLEITNNIVRENKIASRKMLDSLTFDIKDEITELVLQVKAEDYFKFVDKGRGHGKKMIPPDDLKRWMRIKGIPEQFSYPINRKIGRFGIDPTDILAISIKNLLASDNIKNVERGFKKDVEKQLDIIVKPLND